MCILHIFIVTYLKSLLDCAIVCNVFAKCLETIKLKTLKIKNRLYSKANLVHLKNIRSHLSAT